MKILIAFGLLAPAVAMAQQPGARVYINQNNPFANYFSAGVAKKKVPVVLTGDRSAEYAVRFSNDSDPGSLTTGIANAVLRGVYDTGASDQISITVINTRTKDIVFSDSCKKQGGRMQSVAECLAKHWKSHIQK
jgi:hypothetical protein